MKTALIAIFIISVIISVPGREMNGDRGVVLKINTLPTKYNYSFINLPIQVLLINQSETTIHVIKPVVNKNLVFSIHDMKGNLLATSPQTIRNFDAKPDENAKIKLSPNESWSTSCIKIPQVTSPILPVNQEVIIVAKYSGDHNASPVSNQLKVMLHAPQNEMQDGFIAEEKALSIAKDEILKTFKTMDFLKKSSPVITIRNDIYVITYPGKNNTGSRGGDYILEVKINAFSGKVISILAGS